jgi:hypothetical protein
MIPHAAREALAVSSAHALLLEQALRRQTFVVPAAHPSSQRRSFASSSARGVKARKAPAAASPDASAASPSEQPTQNHPKNLVIDAYLEALPALAADFTELQPANVQQTTVVGVLEGLGVLERRGALHRWNAAQAEVVQNLDAFTDHVLRLEAQLAAAGSEAEEEDNRLEQDVETSVSARVDRMAATRNVRALHAAMAQLGGKAALDAFLGTMPARHRLGAPVPAALGPLPADTLLAFGPGSAELAMDSQPIDFGEIASQFEVWSGTDAEAVSRLSSPRPGEMVRRASIAHDSGRSPRDLGRAGAQPPEALLLVSPREAQTAAAASAWPTMVSTPEPLHLSPVRLPQWTLRPVVLGQAAEQPGAAAQQLAEEGEQEEEVLSDADMLRLHDAALETSRARFESNLKKAPARGHHHHHHGHSQQHRVDPRRPVSRTARPQHDAKKRLRGGEAEDGGTEPLAL